MGIRSRIKRLERLQAAEACPECAGGPVEIITHFDHFPLPPEDTRTYEELCKIPLCSYARQKCPRRDARRRSAPVRAPP